MCGVRSSGKAVSAVLVEPKTNRSRRVVYLAPSTVRALRGRPLEDTYLSTLWVESLAMAARDAG